MLKVMGSLTAALALTACAAGPSSNTYSHAAGDGSFTGWVRFANGEFQLYGDRDQVLQPFSRPCVSGAASRDEMRQARQDLNGVKVTIAGRTAPWSQASRRIGSADPGTFSARIVKVPTSPSYTANTSESF